MNELDRIDITQMLLHENGSVLYRGAEGVLVRGAKSGTLLTDMTDGDFLVKKLRELSLTENVQLTVKSESVRDTLRAQLGCSDETPCTQWVYEKKEAPAYPACDIRPLTLDDAQTVAEHYGLVEHSLPYATDRIRAGRMWGLVEDGVLAGFIGMHREGAMGMLEILPEYRRKGYGFALEAFLIGWQIQQGWTPYCHVVYGNEASEHLQIRLGMTKCDAPAIWTWND